MDNIRTTEWLLLMAMVVHLIMAPWTKVEESFNVQAIHDLLYHRLNFSQYDHHQFPGVVPRSFAGPLSIAAVLLPFIAAFEYWNVAKVVTLFCVRCVLGALVVFALARFCRRIGKRFDEATADFLRLILASQFHLLFYASRPLPNVFALVGVLWSLSRWISGNSPGAIRVAAGTMAVFRCDLALLFGPLFLTDVFGGRLPLFGWNGAIWNGFVGAGVALGFTIPIDSFLWRRFLWPEGEVWWFNVVLNKSHEYGTSPLHWYFTSALPRALLASCVLIPLGPVVDRRLLPILIPTVSFICLYSLLPHKELRFIIYAFPLLNVSAAVVCAKAWLKQQSTWYYRMIAVCLAGHLIANLLASGVFLYASSRNYPGGDALAYLQMHRFDRNKLRTVHIDVFTAQSGVSRFLHLYDSWRYDKTENASLGELATFDFLLVGSSTENVREAALRNFSTSHRLLFPVQSFHRVQLKWSTRFPFVWPVIRFREHLVVLKHLDTV